MGFDTLRDKYRLFSFTLEQIDDILENNPDPGSSGPARPTSLHLSCSSRSPEAGSGSVSTTVP